eukprot:TRINITY_DN9748_c0_g5_i1.p1 TRINITY_DN9748_c0_g5~~TRINITY_DN9748_c0_g5_i1.p1  ORF type:complete len:650 (-),score=88.83 TRINITY_DN9748_c0_g5_i1:68-2017(-)
MRVVHALRSLFALPSLLQGWLGERDGPDRWARAQRLAETHPDIFLEDRASGGRLLVPIDESREEETSMHCAPLTNHGTHFTVEIDVGTPSQKFQVVADTGSSLVIVPSCMCVKRGKCSLEDGCFQGTNRSSTFSMVRMRRLQEQFPTTTVKMAVVTFGTGTIQAAMAEDVVGVGGVRARLSRGLLLMVSKFLRQKGGFGGILGLGLPHGYPRPPAYGGQSLAQYGKKSSMLLNIKPPAFNVDIQSTSNDEESQERISMIGRGFLAEARIQRFSMCFNDGADGVLRLHSPRAEFALKSIGTMHWGLDFKGISVGSDSRDKVLFCKSSSQYSHQETACGAIPDSGTTVMTGPRDHVIVLFQSLCDNWKRCTDAYEEARLQFEKHFQTVGAGLVQNSTEIELADVSEEKSAKEFGASSEKENQSDAQIPPQMIGGISPRTLPHVMVPPGHIVPPAPMVPPLHGVPGAGPGPHDGPTKHSTFVRLLHDCYSWMENISGLDELPDIHLHVAGEGGEHVTALKIPGAGYVLEMMEAQLQYARSRLNGIIPVLYSRPTGRKKRFCNPAFGVMNFTTAAHGPVWILGTPLFYQYQVGYDLADGGSISFLQQPCGTCESSSGSSLLQGEGVETRVGPRPPRFVSGPFREPSYDLSAGL